MANESFFETAIQKVSPQWALSRARARQEIGVLKSAVPYQSAYQGRVDSYWPLSLSMTGIREINRFNLRRMRDRARQLERENVLACAILDRCVDNVIGTGMRLMPSTASEELNKRILELWENWHDTADITGRFSFGQWQQMIYRSYLRDGDVGTVLISQGDDAFLQSLSGDYIDSIDSAILDNVNHVHGMELNGSGRVTQYYVKSADGEKGSWKETAVPARNMVFYHRGKQLTDYRGEPLFAPIFTKLEQIDKYTEAEVIKKRLEACQGIFVKKQTGMQSYGALGSVMNAAGSEQKSFNFEPAMVHYLLPGEDIASFNPSATGQDFSTLMKCLNGFLGLNCGLNLQMLLLDYTGLSYSSAKATSLQSQRHFTVQQQRFIDRNLKRIYYWRLSKWVKSGDLIIPKELVSNYWQHLWVPPGFPLLDPNKEITAQLAEIDGGLNDHVHAALSRGRRLEDIVKSQATANTLFKEYDIKTCNSTLTRDNAIMLAVAKRNDNADPTKDPNNSETDDDAENET